ncbi:hypothetical protein [Vibrio mangrovi]|uniref:Uncharacterized protein n=1 Tax=Vibrio mangrovi TaxID=474394 RepID=A0A1Y6IXI5_9VIBR|nr:hypothetical protein [Vibrio mangrovi]MDW6002858.1 hypothetical protein [Vibrio mangrovi]SMS02348.1 hypothetical protein VIM7927_03669 [Vibrio mangrovi]
MKNLILYSLFIFCYQSSSLSAEELPLDDSKIGWMHGKCIAIKNPHISPRQEFTIIHLGEKTPSSVGTIVEKTEGDESCYPLLEDRKEINIENGYDFYLVRTNEDVNLAIGTFYLEKTNGLNYGYCQTSEGIEYFITKNDKKIWEGYYYLGYESKPTCKDDLTTK